jgi:hypothetical protein
MEEKMEKNSVHPSMCSTTNLRTTSSVLSDSALSRKKTCCSPSTSVHHVLSPLPHPRRVLLVPVPAGGCPARRGDHEHGRHRHERAAAAAPARPGSPWSRPPAARGGGTCQLGGEERVGRALELRARRYKLRFTKVGDKHFKPYGSVANLTIANWPHETVP